MLCGALEGIGSVRELLRVAAMRLDLRRFLGHGFSDRVPVHQTISPPIPAASSTRRSSTACSRASAKAREHRSNRDSRGQ